MCRVTVRHCRPLSCQEMDDWAVSLLLSAANTEPPKNSPNPGCGHVQLADADGDRSSQHDRHSACTMLTSYPLSHIALCEISTDRQVLEPQTKLVRSASSPFDVVRPSVRMCRFARRRANGVPNLPHAYLAFCQVSPPDCSFADSRAMKRFARFIDLRS